MADLIGIGICALLYPIAVIILGASITAGIFVFHIAVVPIIFKYSKKFRRTIIFANFVQWPLSMDYEHPSTLGIDGGRNMTLEYQSKVDKRDIKIGIWHILPKSIYEKLKEYFQNDTDKIKLNKLLDAELANSGKPIILYCHGNANSRGASHRLDLYKVLQSMDYHIIAFDYRGYGDSTNVEPSEQGVVEDTLMVYDWICSLVQRAQLGEKPPIFIWGHSLGTGISSHLLGNLEELSKSVLNRPTSLPQPKGLILESPFNNLAEAIMNYPLSKLITWLPYYSCTVLDAFDSPTEPRFQSDRHLLRVPELPMLILHAKDDIVIPFSLGVKLYKTVLESRKDGSAPVSFHSYEKSEKLGHKWICNANDLDKVIGKFITDHR